MTGYVRKSWKDSKHPLAKVLQAQDISPGVLAERSKVDLATISRVLTGGRERFSPEAARAIAEALPGISIEELLYGEKL